MNSHEVFRRFRSRQVIERSWEMESSRPTPGAAYDGRGPGSMDQWISLSSGWEVPEFVNAKLARS